MAHSCPPALQTWPAPPWGVNLATIHNAEHCALSDPQLSLHMGSHVFLREWVRAPLVQLATLPGSALGPRAELRHSEPEVPLHLGTAPLYLQQFLIRGQVLQFLLQATGLGMQYLQCRSCWQMPERSGCLRVGSPSETSPTAQCSLHTQSP